MCKYQKHTQPHQLTSNKLTEYLYLSRMEQLQQRDACSGLHTRDASISTNSSCLTEPLSLFSDWSGATNSHRSSGSSGGSSNSRNCGVSCTNSTPVGHRSQAPPTQHTEHISKHDCSIDGICVNKRSGRNDGGMPHVQKRKRSQHRSWLLLPLLMMMLASCGTPVRAGKWTLLIYMIGDNSLECFAIGNLVVSDSLREDGTRIGQGRKGVFFKWYCWGVSLNCSVPKVKPGVASVGVIMTGITTGSKS